MIGQLPYTYDFVQRTDIANIMGYRIASLTHRTPQPVTAIWTIFYPFVTPLWVAIILSTLFVCFMLLVINRLKFKSASPSFRIVSISLLSILSESFPSRWFIENISVHVILVLYIWLPMSFMLGSVYKSSLLQFLVAGEVEDPADTFEKVIERDMIIVTMTGNALEQLFSGSPYETTRLAYEHGKDKGGYIPWGKVAPEWLQNSILEGRGVGFSTENLQIGNRHRSQTSKKERPVGYMVNGFLFKRNSIYQSKMQPILMLLIDTGIYEHLKEIFLWNRARPERDYYRAKKDENLVVLTWEHVGWTFLLVASSGLAMASVTFIIEVFYDNTKKTGNTFLLEI